MRQYLLVVPGWLFSRLGDNPRREANHLLHEELDRVTSLASHDHLVELLYQSVRRQGAFADDAGIFPELLEREERELRVRKSREVQLDGELTERELDVLRLFVEELSTQQIVQNLYVAPSRVRSHIKSVYRKLGTSSRKEAVEEARAKGLI